MKHQVHPKYWLVPTPSAVGKPLYYGKTAADVPLGVKKLDFPALPGANRLHRGKDMYRHELKATVPREILDCSAVSREINFTSKEEIVQFRLEQRVFLEGVCIEGGEQEKGPDPDPSLTPAQVLSLT